MGALAVCHAQLEGGRVALPWFQASAHATASMSPGPTLNCNMEPRSVKPLDVHIVHLCNLSVQLSEHILFMEFTHLTDVDALAEATIAWARTNVHEGTRVCSSIEALANLPGEDTYLFRKSMPDLLVETGTVIHWLDSSEDLRGNQRLQWLNGLSQASLDDSQGYPLLAPATRL